MQTMESEAYSSEILATFAAANRNSQGDRNSQPPLYDLLDAIACCEVVVLSGRPKTKYYVYLHI